MKKIILSALLMSLSAVSFGLTVSVHNTSNSIEECDGCSYEVRLKNLVFTKPGSFNWGYTESGYTNVLPGNTKNWTVSPPAGYTPDWSTLQIYVRYCTSTIRIYGNSGPVVDDFNNCSCVDNAYLTYWFRNADGDYDVQCEYFAERSQALPADIQIHPATVAYPTMVSPNPSAGIFTLVPGTELSGQTFSARVTDITGKLVYSKENLPGDGPVQMDLTALPRGLYLLNIVSGDKKQALKLMKE